MGIDHYLLRSSILLILAQRLVRVLCQNCREPYSATAYELMQLGVDPERLRWRAERNISVRYQHPSVDYEANPWLGEGTPTFYRAKGCEQCDHKGFAGRLGIYELLITDDIVGALILKNADAQTIKRAAQSHGMDSLRDDGARKVFAGLTTVEEVVAATQDDVIVDE